VTSEVSDRDSNSNEYESTTTDNPATSAYVRPKFDSRTLSRTIMNDHLTYGGDVRPKPPWPNLVSALRPPPVAHYAP